MSLRDELHSTIDKLKAEIAYLEGYIVAGGNWFHEDIAEASSRVAGLFDSLFHVKPEPEPFSEPGPQPVTDIAPPGFEPEPVAEPISESPKE